MRKILFLSLALTLSVGLWAETAKVSYVYPVYNTEGDPKSGIKEWKTGEVEATIVENAAECTSLGRSGETTWYVVQGEMILSKGVICYGVVNLILADGAKFDVTGMRRGEDPSDNRPAIYICDSFTIYGQTNQSGRLNAWGPPGRAGINGGSGSSIIINGGVIYAEGLNNAAGIGGERLSRGCNIIINGGVVTARAETDAVAIGGGMDGEGCNIVINGGTITAIGGVGASGIGSGTGGSASNIFVATDLIVKADNNNPPTTVIANDGSDLAGLLNGKRYVTIEDPSDDTALPTLPYERKVGKGSFKVMENGHFRIIRGGKAYTIMGVEE